MSETKVCKICNEEKDINEFYSQKKTKKDGTLSIYYNPECKGCTKKRSSNWEKNNYEKVKENRKKLDSERKKYFREYRMKHKDQRYKILKEWQINNPDKVKEYNEKREMNKKHKISKKEWESCKSYFLNSCAYCGISEEQAKLEQGQNLHKEHVIHNGANDLSNCVPSCRVCNSSKHNRELDEWYNEENQKYSIERLEKIHTWLNEDYKTFIKNN